MCNPNFGMTTATTSHQEHLAKSRGKKDRSLNMGSQMAFSLVEIMVAMTVGMLLSAGIGQLYLSTKQTYRMQEQLARFQEDARFVMEVLTSDIRKAGYAGCSSRQTVVENTLNGKTSVLFDFSNAIQGFEAMATNPGWTYGLESTNPTPSSDISAWTPQLALPPNTVIAGNDVLAIKGTLGQGARVTANTPASLSIQVSSTQTLGCTDSSTRINGICKDDLAMITDCARARIFKVSSIDGATGNITHTSSGNPGDNACTLWDGTTPGYTNDCKSVTFSSDARIFPVATIVYFIGQRTPEAGPSLFRQAGSTAPQELAEGVENMQVLYGLDTVNNDLSVDQYLPADAITDWSLVRNVRVGLLMRSLREINDVPDTAVYSVNGTIIDPMDDRRIRKVFPISITVRNRSG
jgi:type IV pilus assembly protein PilW